MKYQGVPGYRLLALLLGVSLCLGLCRTAVDLTRETQRAASLHLAITQTQEAISRLHRSEDSSDQAVRDRAFQELGLISPGDIVFYDAGTWNDSRQYVRTSQGG